MEKSLQMAEQQFIGFRHAQQGYSLIELIKAMGLTHKEWVYLKEITGLPCLTSDQKIEIDNFFK